MISETNDYKIAFIDIENGPNLGYVWEKYEQNVLSYEREWCMLSYAVKWAGQKQVECYALPDFPLYKKDPHDDFELISKLWHVFDTADLIIAHNGDKFDIRKANARYVINGLHPPSPYRSFDTLKEARKHFYFNSNKLEDLCKLFGIGAKVKHAGFEMWLGCMRGEDQWWSTMKKYNIRDVVLLEKLYYIMRPWSVTHPNISLGTGKAHCCPVCGSDKTVEEGHRYLKTYKVKRYSCKSCTHWSSGAREKLSVPVLT